MKNKVSKNYGSGLVLFSALMFGSYGVWSRLMGESFDNFFQGWTRALIILVLLTPWAIYKKEIIKIERQDIKWVVVFMVCTSLTQAPLYYAFNHMHIGSASLLFFVSMFLTMYLVGFIFLGEKITKVKIICFGLAIVGMYLVFSFSVESFALLAATMAIANGVASGGEVAFSKKLSDKYSPLYLIILSWAIILVTNSIISLLIGETQTTLSFSMSWLWQLYYSLTSLFAFWLVIAGFKYVDAGIGALLGLLEIVFSVLFGILIFKEVLSVSVGLGALLILVAAGLPHVVSMMEKKKVVE